MPLYQAYNAAMATTTGPAPVDTGTSLKTMLQIAAPSTRRIYAVAWGISFSGFAAAAPLVVELLETDVAATVTAHIASGVQPYNDPGATPSLVTLGTSATGYTASVEGSITATRHADLHQIAPSGQCEFMWPLGQEFGVGVSKFLRVRVKAAAAVNCLTWVRWLE